MLSTNISDSDEFSVTASEIIPANVIQLLDTINKSSVASTTSQAQMERKLLLSFYTEESFKWVTDGRVTSEIRMTSL